MKNKFELKKIDNSMVNQYLKYKNLLINRKYSSNKIVIQKIDHYIWWLNNQKKRSSALILKNKKPIFISTCDHQVMGKHMIVYSGLLSCTKETNLFDLLKAIKFQNIYLNKRRKNYCFISIDKKNKVLLHHWKYFGYNELNKRNDMFKKVKKIFNVKSNFNVYYKYII